MPLDRVSGDTGVTTMCRGSDWINRLVAAASPVRTLFVSHLSARGDRHAEQAPPRHHSPPAHRHRAVLGDRKALQAGPWSRNVQKVAKGDRFGYRQHKVRGDGYLVVVSGGTAHGVGLENPKNFGRGVSGLTPARSSSPAPGSALLNRTMSPYSWQGRQLWFAEPPHIAGVRALRPGGAGTAGGRAEMAAEVSLVMTHFDGVVFA